MDHAPRLRGEPAHLCYLVLQGAHGPVPRHAFRAVAVFFALLFTGLNLRGIQATARTNQLLTLFMGGVVVWTLYACWRFIFARPDLSPAEFTRPFYDPASFSWAHLSNGASIAVLTYIGFDASPRSRRR